jgi:hypothetical protein
MKLPATEGIPNEVVFPRGYYQAYAPQWTAAGAIAFKKNILGLNNSML